MSKIINTETAGCMLWRISFLSFLQAELHITNTFKIIGLTV